MKILWLTYDIPFPLNSGGKHRAYHLMRNLGSGYEITLYSYYRSNDQLAFIPELRKFISRIEVFKRPPVWSPENLIKTAFSKNPLLTVSYINKSLQNSLLRELSQTNYDLIHLEFFGVSWILPCLKERGYKVVLGNENVEYRVYERYVSQVRNKLLKKVMEFDVEKMRRLEERYWQIADANIAVSEIDLKEMKEAGARDVHVVPNGVDVSQYRRFVKTFKPSKIGRSALFVGDLLYQQNNEAVRWFIEKVLPLVRKKMPEFKLIVVTRHRPEWTRNVGDFLEIREDFASEFTSFSEATDIFVLPVWIKSGTNIKLLQAMAVGFPVVSTSLGASGYGFKDGCELLIADTAEEFAKKTLDLLEDVSLQSLLSQKARKAVEDYDWSNSAKTLIEIYEKVKLS